MIMQDDDTLQGDTDRHNDVKVRDYLPYRQRSQNMIDARIACADDLFGHVSQPQTWW